MPITADQIYPEPLQPEIWKKRPPLAMLQQLVAGEPVSITQPQVIVASHIMPLLPTLPPISHS